MGRAGFFIFIFFFLGVWVCRSVAGVLGFWWRGGREGASVVRGRGLTDGRAGGQRLGQITLR